MLTGAVLVIIKRAVLVYDVSLCFPGEERTKLFSSKDQT